MYNIIEFKNTDSQEPLNEANDLISIIDNVLFDVISPANN